jgi:glucose/mannose-6-phosphate isomerase
MGGSGLALHALTFLGTRIPIFIHQDYDLPREVPSGSLLVAISHSGNTAETLSFAHAALRDNLPLAVVTGGGELEVLAEEHELPTVRIPEKDVVPRDALPVMVRALLWLLNEEVLYAQMGTVEADGIRAAAAESVRGYERELSDKIVVCYSSRRNAVLGRIWKSMLAETAKIPTFAGTFPEANHDEMQGFDLRTRPSSPATGVHVVLIRDQGDDVRIGHRMDVFEEVAREQGISVSSVMCPEPSRTEQLIGGWVRARTVAAALAREARVDPYDVPLITEFKKRMP